MKKYSAIIFDLGRVLIDWNPEAIIKDLFKHEQEIPMHLLSLTEGPFFKALDRGELQYANAHMFIPEGYDHEHVLRFLRGLTDYLVPIQAGIEIFELIKQHGYKTYILSNFGHEEYDIVSGRNTGLFEQFDGGIVSAKVGHIKPEPEIYHALLNTYNLKPEECLFIDDRPENIHAAQALGIDGIICSNHDYVLARLHEMGVINPIITQEHEVQKYTF